MTNKWSAPCRALQALPADEQPHASWDLDIGDAISWQRAIQTCIGCPVIDNCRQERDEKPQSQIWAGVAYTETGIAMDTAGLRRLAATRRNAEHRGRPRKPAVAA